MIPFKVKANRITTKSEIPPCKRQIPEKKGADK